MDRLPWRSNLINLSTVQLRAIGCFKLRRVREGDAPAEPRGRLRVHWWLRLGGRLALPQNTCGSQGTGCAWADQPLGASPRLAEPDASAFRLILIPRT